MIDLLADWIGAGGPIVVILGVLSVVSLALVAIKTAQLLPAAGGGAARAAALERWTAGAKAEAREAMAGARRPVDRMLRLAMDGLAARADAAALRAEVERAGAAELEALGRHLRLLDVIATTSPLLGLLGTVIGMISAFQSLELAGGSANAAVLAGGIWQALLTTAAGLIVAIPAGVAAGLLSARVDRIGHEIEDSVSRLFAAEGVPA